MFPSLLSQMLFPAIQTLNISVTIPWDTLWPKKKISWKTKHILVTKSWDTLLTSNKITWIFFKSQDSNPPPFGLQMAENIEDALNNFDCGSGCGSVGRAVASDIRGPRFKFCHPQNLYWTLFTVNCIEKTKKEKEAGNGPVKNNFEWLAFPGFPPPLKRSNPLGSFVLNMKEMDPESEHFQTGKACD